MNSRQIPTRQLPGRAAPLSPAGIGSTAQPPPTVPPSASGGSGECLLRRLRHTLHRGSPAVVELLFGNPSVVSLVIEGLPPPCRIIITRLVALKDGASPWPPMVSWVAGNQPLLRLLIAELRRSRVLRPKLPPVGTSGGQAPAGGATGSPPGRQPGAAASGSDAGSAVSGPGGAAAKATKYELHPTFRDTLVSMLKGEGSTPAYRKHGWCVPQPLEVAMTLDLPDANTLLTCAQKQWGELLRWLFAHSVKTTGSIVPTTVQTFSPPGGALTQVLQATGLAAPPEPLSPSAMGQQDQPRRSRIAKPAFQWLLADLGEQVAMLLHAYLDQVRTPSPTEASLLQEAKLLSFLSDVARAKIGEPLVLKEQLVPEVSQLLLLCKDLGLVMRQYSRIGEIVIPTVLARTLSIDAETDSQSIENWSLSQMFGTKAYQEWQRRRTSILALPRYRYHPACLAKTTQQLNLASSDFGFDISIICDTRNEFVQSDTSQQPTLALATAKKAEAEAPNRGLIVESNFRVFAYRPDELELSVLSNLCEIRVVTPTMVVGILTRESVLNAFHAGLGAAQIQKFLANHAHSSVQQRVAAKGTREHDSTQVGTPTTDNITLAAVLPENVATQLELWEAQQSALSLYPAVVFEFTEEQELASFPFMVQRAKQGHYLLCHTPMSQAQSQIGTLEFNTWREEILARVRKGDRTTQADYRARRNWFAHGAVIVIKASGHDDFQLHLSRARSARSLNPPASVVVSASSATGVAQPRRPGPLAVAAAPPPANHHPGAAAAPRAEASGGGGTVGSGGVVRLPGIMGRQRSRH